MSTYGTLLSFVENTILFDGVKILFNTSVVPVASEDFFFPHTCVVYRSAGVDVSTGEETFVGVSYGPCSYDNNPSGSTAFTGKAFQSTPTVLIPDTNVLYAINDRLLITVENGRIIEGTVKQFETIPERGIHGTTLWLKGAQDE